MQNEERAGGGGQKPEAGGRKPELGAGAPPPRIGWNRLALIRNQVFTRAKARGAGRAGRENGSSGRMPEARYTVRAGFAGVLRISVNPDLFCSRFSNSSKWKPKRWRQARRLSYDPGCAGVADIAANPKLLRSCFHRSFLPSFCRFVYSMGVKSYRLAIETPGHNPISNGSFGRKVSIGLGELYA